MAVHSNIANIEIYYVKFGRSQTPGQEPIFFIQLEFNDNRKLWQSLTLQGPPGEGVFYHPGGFLPISFEVVK